MSRACRIPLLLAVVVVALLVGCSTHHTVTAPRIAQPSPPTSPAGVLQLFHWSWENRDTLALGETLTQDFRFVFAGSDSTGARYANGALDRDQFLQCMRHLFGGGGPLPPARRIVLSFDPDPIAVPDERPGKASPWHRTIDTPVGLTVDYGEGTWRVVAYVRFFVVRGDSAAIPPDLAARGFGADSTRWWIEQLQESSAIPAARLLPARPLPSQSLTWGRLLDLYY